MAAITTFAPFHSNDMPVWPSSDDVYDYFEYTWPIVNDNPSAMTMFPPIQSSELSVWLPNDDFQESILSEIELPDDADLYSNVSTDDDLHSSVESIFRQSTLESYPFQHTPTSGSNPLHSTITPESNLLGSKPVEESSLQHSIPISTSNSLHSTPGPEPCPLQSTLNPANFLQSTPTPVPSPLHSTTSPVLSPLQRTPSPVPSPLHRTPTPVPSPLHRTPTPVPSPLLSLPTPEPSPLCRTPTPVPSPLHSLPTPVPSPLRRTPTPVPSPLHSIPTPASSPLQKTPAHLVIEPKLEPNQDEIEDNLPCRLGTPVLNSTNEKESMEFEDNSASGANNTKKEIKQQESTGSETGTKNKIKTENDEDPTYDDEMSINDRSARSSNSPYGLRPGRRSSLHRQSRPTVRKTVVLWKFIKELLDKNDTCVSWISREERSFKFVDSKQAAKLWGQRKNKRNMTYEKMSRALRYYYDRQIIFHEEGQKLMYRFGDGAWEDKEQAVTDE